MIDYVRFGLFAVLDNLWTCVVVLTAAFSFQRIRAGAAAAVRATLATSRSSTADLQPRLQEDASSNGCSSVSDGKCRPSWWMEVSRVTTASPHPLVLAPGGYEMTKRRFTVYYDNDRVSDENQVEADPVAVVGAEEDGGGGVEWWSGWERVLRTRNGDVGWCRYQDLTVLDGSVVRLWHGKREIKMIRTAIRVHDSSGWVRWLGSLAVKVD